MNTIDLFSSTCMKASRAVTRSYSTSFSLGVRMLHPRFRDPIHAIYGFVRFADEIVDTFHEHDRRDLLDRFIADTWHAIGTGISLNPILHGFQAVVRRYAIDRTSVEAFFHSMTMDLDRREHDRSSYAQYVLGSAEVVGLMCLRVFCEGDDRAYQRLREPAQRLGAAFQKVNFLRDLKDDHVNLGRCYFPGIHPDRLDSSAKCDLESEIQADFSAAYRGIRQLPKGARLGVYLAYRYYHALLQRIRIRSADGLTDRRIRVSGGVKAALLMKSYVRHNLGLL